MGGDYTMNDEVGDHFLQVGFAPSIDSAPPAGMRPVMSRREPAFGYCAHCNWSYTGDTTRAVKRAYDRHVANAKRSER